MEDTKQLLHLVFGGRLKEVGSTDFADPAALDVVGIYPNYAEAHKAWSSVARATIDDAEMRYFIVHLHRLLDPHTTPQRVLIFWGYLSGFLSLAGLPFYLYDIVKGSTRPERASWFIWLILGGIALLSQRAEGAGASLWMTAAQTFNVLIIFLFSLWRGMGGFSHRDIIALSITVLGLLSQFYTQNASYALLAVIIVDAAGFILTVIKAYENPDSETILLWLLGDASALAAIAAAGTFSPLIIAYPLYIFIANSGVILAVIIGRSNAKSTEKYNNQYYSKYLIWFSWILSRCLIALNQNQLPESVFSC